MKRYKVINRNKDFLKAYRTGKCVSGRICAVYFRKEKRNRIDGQPVLRVGISTGKKIGCAVERSRARRVIRAALRECPLPAGYDVIIACRAGAVSCKSYEAAQFLRKKVLPAMMEKKV
ncbi:MAG: ribonuclease P protein component [Oscillospiraceae bacterium]|nr:ribonuclease P protein component [Oscillospiraceae bacterium]